LRLDKDRADYAAVPETHMIRLPESSRFHVIDESKVLPRFGHLMPRPIYVYLPELASTITAAFSRAVLSRWPEHLDDPHCCFVMAAGVST